MKFSSLTQRVAAAGMTSWQVHHQAIARRRNGEDIILLSIGQDSAAGPAERIIERAVSSLHAGRHHYTDCQGEPALREAIAADHKRKTGQSVDAGCCTVFAGAQNALFAVLACLLEAGDEVLVPEPYYSTYPATLTAMGARMLTVATAPENGFQLDAKRLAAAITPATRAVVINTPNNPTGAIYSRESLEIVAQACKEHDLWLVCDEVYADFCFDKPHRSAASLAGIADRCVVISSLSKSQRMPGWRVGWAVGPEDLAAHLTELNLCMLYGLPGFIQDAAVEALTGSASESGEICNVYKGRRDLVCSRLHGLDGLRVHRPEGGMFVMLDIRELEISSLEFAAQLLERHALALLPADGFGACASGHLRLGLVASQPVLDKACDAIIEYLQFLQSR